jgi:hypothetical protein
VKQATPAHQKEKEEQHKTPRIGDVRITAAEAREALRIALKVGQAQNHAVLIGLCTGMMRICDSLDILARGMEFIRNRVTVISQSLTEKEPIDDYRR